MLERACKPDNQCEDWQANPESPPKAVYANWHSDYAAQRIGEGRRATIALIDWAKGSSVIMDS